MTGFDLGGVFNGAEGFDFLNIFIFVLLLDGDGLARPPPGSAIETPISNNQAAATAVFAASAEGRATALK